MPPNTSGPATRASATSWTAWSPTSRGRRRSARSRAGSAAASTWRGCSSATGTCSALDEPTNHLDIRAITWLAEHLKKRWKPGAGALLVVTHDRWFLDEVCLSMWEVHDKRVEPFEGGYSAYIMQRVERDRVAALAEQKRQNELRRELAWLSRGAQARATKPKFRVGAARAHRRRAAFAQRAGAQAHGHGAPGQAGGRPRAGDVRFDGGRSSTTWTGSSGRATATASSARTARARPRCCA